MYITLSQKITNELKQRILSGHYPAGYRLEEIPISKELGASRTPVRAALTALLNMGLLDYQAKRGYMITQFNEKAIQDAYEVRATLEGLACRKAAEAGLSEEQIAHLQGQIETGDRLLATGRLAAKDVEPYRCMNVEFHQNLVKAAANTWITRFVEDCHEIPLVSQRAIVWHDSAVMLRSHDDHHRILDAIIRRQPSRAEDLMREHIYYSGLFILQDVNRAYDTGPAAKSKTQVHGGTTI